MKTIYVAVGSTRAPKLNGVRQALSEFGTSLDPFAFFEVVGEEAPSGVGHTPLSRAETMAGAHHRAEALVHAARQRHAPWNYFVGLEGGLDVVKDVPGGPVVFLESWAYVTDGNGLGAYGHSGGVQVPDSLALAVIDRGVELSQAVDELAGGRDIRNAQGAWGVLTRNLLTRQDSFRIAVTAAFARFFNSAIYRRAASARS